MSINAHADMRYFMKHGGGSGVLPTDADAVFLDMCRR
jgi:hypothetical protein